MRDGVHLRERALPVEGSSAINRCIQLLDSTVSQNSNAFHMTEADWRVPQVQVTWAKAMPDGVPLKERTLPVEVSSAINRCMQLIASTVSLKSIDVVCFDY